MSAYHRFISFIRRKTSQKYRFNQQFAQKKWEGMRDIADLGRYSIIVGYTKYFCKNPRILDLGCGEGILLEKFASSDYSFYLGVDFSEVAITSARRLETAKAHFLYHDLNKPGITGAFDVIIYNESLYYLNHPREAVQALFGNLSPDGIFIVSMVDKHGKERTDLWNELEQILEPIEKTKITNKAGDSWTIQVYKVRR